MQHQDEIRKKILGCWLGKTVGGVLGTPWESDPRTHALTWYDPMPDQALPNDDLELQILWLNVIEEIGLDFDADDLAAAFLAHVPYNPGEYAYFKRNYRRGIHPPTMYFPLIVEEALMFEPTETESKETLDRAAEVFGEIVAIAYSAPETLHDAPHNAAIRRPDEVKAARNPVVMG